MRLLQDYLKEDFARVRVAKKRALLDVWLWWLAALLTQDGIYDDEL